MWQYSEPLISKELVCDECHGDLVLSDDKPAEVTIYTRNGTKFSQHFTKVCPNRWCRKRFLFGYQIKNETKVYDKIRPDSQYLIISNETAFQIDYLYESSLHFLHSNSTFQGLSDIYNQFHNFRGENVARKDLISKRLASGFFLYSFLEMTSRCGIYPKLDTHNNWLDESILTNYPLLKKVFSNIWSSPHTCKVEHCETMMVTDGGMKLNRKVCAAKFSVVRVFKHSDKTVLTGCTAMPSPSSPFCSEHANAETPVLLAEKVTSETRNRLWNSHTKSQTTNRNLPNDSVFTVETVLNARKKKNNLEYLVKFAGFPFPDACWEPIGNLPSFIVEHYKDVSKHGTPLPKPSVKYTVQVGNGTEVYHHLEWKASHNVGDKELSLKDGETLFDLDQDKLSEEELRSTCNTRKVKDKRDRRHTAGILISATPCGRIPHIDELFVCESINQVHGSLIEFLGNLEPELRSQFKIWFFDDMCHLKPHAEKPKNANQNEVTKLFAELPKAVDKFHFPVHKKTDKYCQDNCNPNKELKKMNISKLNTPACEQAFKWLNAFKNLKTMNEARFKLFLLYMIDLHNLHIEKRVHILANPLNDKREEACKMLLKSFLPEPTSDTNDVVDILTADVDKLLKISEPASEKVPESEGTFEKLLKISEPVSETEHESHETFEDYIIEDSSGSLKCKLCPGQYKKSGHLRNHLETKHNKVFRIVCSSCGKQFPDSSRLCRHNKSCK
jgi:hypothetical protein